MMIQQLKWRFLAMVLLYFAVLGSVCAANRFTISADGQTVTDNQTGLVWQRCTVGNIWNGTTCAGVGTNYTHEQALLYAQTQKGWRLPNVKELASLVSETRDFPVIDTQAFPNTMSVYYWSSSPMGGTGVNYSETAWCVNFGNGFVYWCWRKDSQLIRLVR